MYKPKWILCSCMLSFSAFGQKQITEFSPTSVTSHYPSLIYLHKIDNDFYFKDYNTIFKFSNEKLDTLMSIKGKDFTPLFSEKDNLYVSEIYTGSGPTKRIISALDFKNKSWIVKDTVDDFKDLGNGKIGAFINDDYFEIDYANRTKSHFLHSVKYNDIYNKTVFEAVLTKNQEKFYGFIDEKGVLVNLDLPELTNRAARVIKEIGEGYYWIESYILTDYARDDFKDYIFKDGEVYPLSPAGNYQNTSYYIVKNELYEVLFTNDSLSIYKLSKDDKIEIASHPINLYPYYLQVISATSPGVSKPFYASYSNHLLVNSSLYFFRNNTINAQNLSPELRLYKVNLENGEFNSVDVNGILNIEEFKKTSFINSNRNLSMILEANDNKILIFSGLKKTNKANVFEINYDLSDLKKKEDIVFDPRDYVKFENGYFNKSNATYSKDLKNSGDQIIEQLNLPKQTNVTHKEQLTYEGAYFGVTTTGKDHLYILNEENGVNQLSIVNKKDEVAEHNILASLKNISEIKVIDLGEVDLIKLSALADTISISGNYFFTHNKTSGVVNQLDISSYNYLDFRNVFLNKVQDKSIIQGNDFVLVTDSKSGFIIDGFTVLKKQSDTKFIGIKEGKLIEFDAAANSIKELGIKTSIYSYLDNSLFYVSGNSLFKTDFSRSTETLFNGNFTALKNISDTDLLVFQDTERYLYNIKDKNLTKLNIDLPATDPLANNIEVSYYKFKDDLLAERYDTQTYLREIYLYDFKNTKLNKIFETRFGEVIYSFKNDEFWIKTSEYPNIEFSFHLYENGKFTEKIKSTQLANSNFDNTNLITYYKSVNDNKIYLYKNLSKKIVEVPTLSSSYKNVRVINSNLNYHFLLATAKENETKDLIKFSVDSLSYSIVTKDVGNFSSYYIDGSEPFFVDTKDSKFSVTYKDSVIYTDNSDSKIDKYGRAFEFKDDLYIIALENGKGYQLYKFEKPISKPEDIVLGNENNEFALTLYPNPSSDFIQIAPKNYDQLNAKLQVVSIDGRVLISEDVKFPYTLNVSKWNRGNYIIHVSNPQKSESFRFIKH